MTNEGKRIMTLKWRKEAMQEAKKKPSQSGVQALPRAKLSLALAAGVAPSWSSHWHKEVGLCQGQEAKPGLESFRRAYCSSQRAESPLTPRLCALIASLLVTKRLKTASDLLKYRGLTDRLGRCMLSSCTAFSLECCVLFYILLYSFQSHKLVGSNSRCIFDSGIVKHLYTESIIS